MTKGILFMIYGIIIVYYNFYILKFKTHWYDLL